MADKIPQKKGPKFSKTEREEKIKEAVRLDCMGWNTFEIGDALGVSQNQAHEYLKTARYRYAECAIKGRTEAIDKSQAQLAYAMRQVTTEWERSKQDAHKEVVEEEPEANCAICGGTGERPEKKLGKKTVPAGKCGPCNGTGKVGGIIKITKTKEGRLADPAYMQLFLKTLEGLRDMLGLDAPKQTINQNQNVNVEHWNILVDFATSNGTSDKVAPKLVEALEETKSRLQGPKLHVENGHVENGEKNGG